MARVGWFAAIGLCTLASALFVAGVLRRKAPVEAATPARAKDRKDNPPKEPMESAGTRPGLPILRDERDLLNGIAAGRVPLPARWTFESGHLLVPALRYSKVSLGEVPTAGTYELEMSVKRLTNASSLTIGFGLKGCPCALVIDGAKPSSTGLDQIDGKPFHENETTKQTSVFKNGHNVRVIIRVSDRVITADADGHRILEWTGEPGRLSLYKRWQSEHPSPLFFVGSWDSSFSISEIKLRVADN